MRRPERITPLDICRAVEGERLFAFRAKLGNPRCVVAGNVKRLLAPAFDETLRAVEKALGRTSIAQLLAQHPA